MKRTYILSAFVLALLLTACGDKPATPADARVESASEAARNDNRAIADRLAEQKGAADTAFEEGRARAEREQLVESLAGVGRRWNDALNEIGSVGRSDLAPAIKKLEALKAEAEAVTVNECTGKARGAMTASMANSIDIYNQFRAGTGKPDDATQQKLQQAAAQFGDYEKQLGGCR